MRAYLRLDPNLRKQKRAYPDGAFRAFVEVLCAAEAQPHRGRFENRPLLRALLGPRAKWINYLWEHGDLEWEEDGVLYVTGWDDWQEGDVTVPERMARMRAKKASRVTPPVTDDVTPDDTVATVYTPSAVSGKRLADGGAEARTAARNDGPPTFMGFRPKSTKQLSQADLLADIQRQHDEAFQRTAEVAARLHSEKEQQ